MNSMVLPPKKQPGKQRMIEDAFKDWIFKDLVSAGKAWWRCTMEKFKLHPPP